MAANLVTFCHVTVTQLLLRRNLPTTASSELHTASLLLNVKQEFMNTNLYRLLLDPTGNQIQEQ